jgi:hypothetical protein
LCVVVLCLFLLSLALNERTAKKKKKKKKKKKENVVCWDE